MKLYKKLYKDKKKLIGKNGKLLRLTLPERVQANGSPLFGIASVIVSVKRNKIEKKIINSTLLYEDEGFSGQAGNPEDFL